MNYLNSVGSYVEKGNYNNYKFFSVKSSREYSNNSNFIKLHNSFGSLNYSFPPEVCIKYNCILIWDVLIWLNILFISYIAL